MVRTNDLTKGPVGPWLVKLAVPMVFGMFSIMTFNLVDTYFVSRLGTKELAAMTFTFPVVMVVLSIALGIGTGTSSVLSRAIGEGDSERVRRLTTDSMILSIVAGIIFVLLGLATMRPVFTAMGATEELYCLIKQYMTVWYMGVGFVVIPITGNFALRASGDTLTPGIIMVGASVINALLDPVMIFGLFGFPRMELTGAALATVITRAFTLIGALYILHHKKHMLALKLDSVREMLLSWRHLLYIGIPASATNVLFALTMGVITRIVAVFGPAAVAAVGAGTRIESLALIVYFAMMSALVPFFGQNWGAGELDRVYTAYRKSNLFSVLWGALCFVLFLLYGKMLGGVFSSDPEVIGGITVLLVISSFSYCFRGICMVAISMFNAVNMPIRAVILNVVRMFVLYIPLAYLGSFYFGFRGVFAGMSLGNFLAGIFSLYWMRNICMRCAMDKYLDR